MNLCTCYPNPADHDIDCSPVTVEVPRDLVRRLMQKAKSSADAGIARELGRLLGEEAY